MDWAEVLVAGIAGGVVSGAAALVSRVLKVPPKYRTSLIIGVAVGVSVGAARVARATGFTDQLSLALGLKTQLEIDSARMAKELLADPRLKAHLQGRSPAEAHEISAALSRQGIPRMNEEKLLVWARLNARMAAESPAFCAARWKQGPPPDVFADAFGRLALAERSQWLDMTLHAMRLAADDSPTPPTHPDALSAGLDWIFAKLGPQQGERARQDAQRTDLSDARACELFKITIEGAQQLPGDTREGFLRSLAQL